MRFLLLWCAFVLIHTANLEAAVFNVGVIDVYRGTGSGYPSRRVNGGALFWTPNKHDKRSHQWPDLTGNDVVALKNEAIVRGTLVYSSSGMIWDGQGSFGARNLKPGIHSVGFNLLANYASPSESGKTYLPWTEKVLVFRTLVEPDAISLEEAIHLVRVLPTPLPLPFGLLVGGVVMIGVLDRFRPPAKPA